METLAAGVEVLLHPVQNPSGHAAQDQGQDNLHQRLHQDGDNADRAALQGGGHAEGGGEQHQSHRVVDGHHQQQQFGQGAVGLVLAHHHEGGRRGGSRSDGAQSDGGGKGDQGGVDEMQDDQGNVHKDGGDHRLQNAHGDGLLAHVLELLQAELIADGEGDEAQGHLAHDIQGGHRFRRAKAQAPQAQRTDAVGSQEQARHQIGGDRGQVQLFGQTAHQQAADQRGRQLDQNLRHQKSTSIHGIQDRSAGAPAISY